MREIEVYIEKIFGGRIEERRRKESNYHLSYKWRRVNVGLLRR